MGKQLICVNPWTKSIEKICERYETDRCCMCPGPKVLIPLQDLKDVIKILNLVDEPGYYIRLAMKLQKIIDGSK
jgi:hypothetical protein